MKRIFLLLFLCFLAFSGTATGSAAEMRSGKGLLYTAPGEVPILFMAGTPEEMGRAHGALLKESIPHIYQRVLLVAAGYLHEKNDWFFDRIIEVQKRSASIVPERFMRELEALADAAGIERRKALEINFFPEMFHCSGIAAKGKATPDGSVIHVRVLDYLNAIGIQDMPVVQVFMPEGYRTWISIGFSGLNGTVTAMNIDGLAMGEMGGRGANNWDGMPMSYLMRQIMEECSTVAEAVELIKSVPLTCEYYYVLSDKSGDMVVIESRAGEEVTVLRPGEEHPLLLESFEDIVWITAPKRQKALCERLNEYYGRIDVENMKKIIRRPVAMTSNLHNAIFLPETLDIHFAYSDNKTLACDRPYQKLNLAELAERYQKLMQEAQ